MKLKQCGICLKEFPALWRAKTKEKPAMCRTCALSDATQIGNYKMTSNKASVSDKKSKPINKKSDKQKKIDAAYKVLNIAYLKKHTVCMAQFEGICRGRATELHHTYFGSNKRKHYLNESTFKALCVACHRHLHDNMSKEELIELGLKILD